MDNKVNMSVPERVKGEDYTSAAENKYKNYQQNNCLLKIDKTVIHCQSFFFFLITTFLFLFFVFLNREFLKQNIQISLPHYFCQFL